MLSKIHGGLVSRQEKLAAGCAADRQAQRNLGERFRLRLEWFLISLFLFACELPALWLGDARSILRRRRKRPDEWPGRAALARRVAAFRRPAGLALAGLALLWLAGVSLLPGSPLAAASRSWVQTDWGGGADALALADTVNGASGAWTKFFYKSDNLDVSTSGQVSLADNTAAQTATTNEDFATGDVALGLRLAEGSVTMKRQDDRPCVSAADCVGAVCTTGYCGIWYHDVCLGLAIHNTDYTAASYRWQNSSVACAAPQCVAQLLVAGNTVDFAAYPARNQCKALGARLPTLDELSCMNANRSALGLSTGYYMSNQEFSAANFYVMNFNDSTTPNVAKTSTSSSYRLRCVRNF